MMVMLGQLGDAAGLKVLFNAGFGVTALEIGAGVPQAGLSLGGVVWLEMFGVVQGTQYVAILRA